MPFTLQPEQRAYLVEIADRMHVTRLKLAAAHTEAAAFAADISVIAQAAIDGRTARWRSGRQGRAAQAWADQWRAFHLISRTDAAAVEVFNALPDAAEEQ